MLIKKVLYLIFLIS